MQPQQINIDQVPKQFSEKMVVGSSKDFFVILPFVGANVTAFAITPEHAKSLAKVLNDHLTKYERDVRKIIDIDGSIPSPIQTTDLPPNTGERGDKR